MENKRHIFSISLKGPYADYLLKMKEHECTSISRYLARILEPALAKEMNEQDSIIRSTFKGLTPKTTDLE